LGKSPSERTFNDLSLTERRLKVLAGKKRENHPLRELLMVSPSLREDHSEERVSPSLREDHSEERVSPSLREDHSQGISER